MNQSRACAALAVLTITVATPPFASAQAWVQPRGIGFVALVYQNIDNTGHRFTDGSTLPVGSSVTSALSLDVDYGITDRLSGVVGLPPVIWAKYTGGDPPPPIPYLPVDSCHCWNTYVQDFGFRVRYNLANGAFALTPSIAYMLPSNDYAYRGEAVAGRRLNELQLALDVGRRLDFISPRLSVQGRYGYSFVERTEAVDIRNDRSNVFVALGYVPATRLNLRMEAVWQRTHGGLRFGSPPPADLVLPGEVNTAARLFEHDRLLRDDYFRLGGGAAWSFGRLDLFASMLFYVAGSDTHSGRSLTVGTSWTFGEVR